MVNFLLFKIKEYPIIHSLAQAANYISRRAFGLQIDNVLQVFPQSHQCILKRELIQCLLILLSRSGIAKLRHAKCCSLWCTSSHRHIAGCCWSVRSIEKNATSEVLKMLAKCLSGELRAWIISWSCYHQCIFSMFSCLQNKHVPVPASEALCNTSSKCNQFRLKIHCTLPCGHSGSKHRGAGSGRPANTFSARILLLSNGLYGTSNYCTLLCLVKEPLLYRSAQQPRGFFHILTLLFLIN